MKKFLTSSVVIGSVVAAAFYGTTAFFSDTETSAGNTFTAGSVTLEISGISHEYSGGEEADQPVFTPNGIAFALSDMKPLDAGTVTYDLTNGANDAYVCAMVTEKDNHDNGRLDPEIEAGDTAGGPGNGELGQFLSFKFGTETGLLSAIGGLWQEVGEVAANGTTNSAIEYCFGEYDGENCVFDEEAEYNLAQTDRLTADIQFYAVQTRNNPDFDCSSLNGDAVDTDVVVEEDDLAQSPEDVVASPSSWFFYNDTDDTIMTIDQFSGTGGLNHFATLADSNGAAYMKLGSETNPRYNIATYQFKDVKLADISSLKYRVYDSSADSSKPFLNFNVDFDNSDTWQRRLVFVPSGLTENVWTEVDTIQGGSAMWSWSGYVANGNKWPDNNTDVQRTWSDILAAFPNAETRSTDSWLGVRVGEPGPATAEGYVDWIEFDGVKHDFSN